MPISCYLKIVFSAIGLILGLNVSQAAGYTSLADLSEPEIFAYMAASRSPRQVVAKKSTESLLPEGFWELPPVESMLTFLDESRSAQHREEYELVYELEEGVAQPNLTRLSLDDSPSQCYSSGSRHLLLSSRPGNSYYAWGRVRTPGGAWSSGLWAWGSDLTSA